MRNFRNLTVFSAAAAAMAMGSLAFAQDDLESLLGLSGDTQPAEAAKVVEAAPAKVVEEAAPVVAPEAKSESASQADVAEKSAEVVTTGTSPATLEEVVAVERLRREAYNKQADREIEAARRCEEREEYADAAKHYANAGRILNDSPEKRELRKQCAQREAEAYYMGAMQENRLGRREAATELMEHAREMRHPKARKQLESWKAEEKAESEKVEVIAVSHRRNEQEFKELRDRERKHLRRACQLLAVRDLDRAMEECGAVLDVDPYNEEALRVRDMIVEKAQFIVGKEFEVTRKDMIADVGKAWRPVYEPNTRELEKIGKGTVKVDIVNGDPERRLEQSIIERMKNMRLPSISFKPPATIGDAIECLKGLSKDFDSPDLPIEKRGFNFMIKTGAQQPKPAATAEATDADVFAQPAEEEAAASSGLPAIQMISATDITFFQALTLVCESVEWKFKVQGEMVLVMPKSMTIDELVTRSYPVVPTFLEKMNTAGQDVRSIQSQFGSSTQSLQTSGADASGEITEEDWKAFFRLMGVDWPDGSSIYYLSTIGKLRVKNTYENLAELEKALTELNVDTKLVEIEARFVEVCQEDLNSLGFEWILNSDYNLNTGNLGKWLGISPAEFTKTTSGGTTTIENEVTESTVGGVTTTKSITSTSTSGGTTSSSFKPSPTADRNLGINAFGGSSDYSNGNRFLSTKGNHVLGTTDTQNDRFVQVNAFLGSADLSMILHMLSQRSDTDLLSAPKVLTSPKKRAMIKVVTEYIYPTEYTVQLQSSSSGSSNNSGGSQSAILAVVEPDNFTTRDVGVILDVTPTLAEDGNLIMLHLEAEVVDEPTWKDYGMSIPFTGNSSLQSFQGIGEIFTSLSTLVANVGGAITQSMRNMIVDSATESAIKAMDKLAASDGSMTTYKAPMEQPFFHTRRIESDVSVFPGATIVMGGLIREERRAIDDKVPFLGDLPFVGRLFRSHAEKTNKRNLLVFITTRLVDVRGREVRLRSAEENDAPVKSAPAVAQAQAE